MCGRVCGGYIQILHHFIPGTGGSADFGVRGGQEPKPTDTERCYIEVCHSNLSNPYQRVRRELYSSQVLGLTGTRTGPDERMEWPENKAAKCSQIIE